MKLIDVDNLTKEYTPEAIGRAALIVSIINFILYFVATFFGGYTLMVLWGWFAVPLGLPAIGIFHALGLGFLVSTFMSGAYLLLAWIKTSIDGEQSKLEKILQRTITSLMSIVQYAFTLLGGFIFQLFM